VVEVLRIAKQSTDSKKNRIVKKDELNGDSEFIVTIRFKGKSSKFCKTNKRQS